MEGYLPSAKQTNTINYMRNIELLQEAISLVRNSLGEDSPAEARIKQFILLNTSKVKGRTFNIYKWVYNIDNLPSQMRGVYHDAERKVAVATDTYSLVVSTKDFVEEHASKIINRKGEVIEGLYPQWHRVIPNIEQMVEVNVDRENLTNLLTEIRAEYKSKKGIEYFGVKVIDDSDKLVYFRPKSCKLILSLPDGKFYYKSECTPLLYKSNDGSLTAIFMPLSNTTDGSRPNFLKP